MEMLEELKRYRDTGLSPEEIMDGRMLTGWIPVDERLPDNPGKYLTQDSIKSMWVLDYYEGWNCFLDADGTIYNKNEITDIEAWQPLPDVYERLEGEIHERKI